jgi:hypothetical protein
VWSLILLGAGASVAAAETPDYILISRCASNGDETSAGGSGSWQISFAEVHIKDQATDGGGWTERHYFDFDAYGYSNGPNGYAEYGTGDDVCLGPAEALGGNLNWTVVSSAPDAASGTKALTDSPNGDYGGSLNITATIDQTFDLSSYSSAELVFFHHHQLRWNSSLDRGYVEVNTGSGWSNLDPEGTPQSDYYRNYAGDDHSYRRGVVDLSSVAGQSNVQIRFRFSTSSSAHDDGWFIDDVRVLGDDTTLFFDDFESGTDGWSLTGSWGVSTTYSYTTSLGTIDADGVYDVTPIVSPASVGEGMGYNAVRAAYTEGLDSWTAYAKVYHNAPQYMSTTPLGELEDICDLTVAVDDFQAPIHDRLVLQNSPNPFNPRTRIFFRLSETDQVTLRVYDEAGRLVRSLLTAEAMPAGEHSLTWDGTNERGESQPSGVYLYQLESQGQTLSRKMVLLK